MQETISRQCSFSRVGSFNTLLAFKSMQFVCLLVSQFRAKGGWEQRTKQVLQITGFARRLLATQVYTCNLKYYLMEIFNVGFMYRFHKISPLNFVKHPCGLTDGFVKLFSQSVFVETLTVISEITYMTHYAPVFPGFKRFNCYKSKYVEYTGSSVTSLHV